MLTCVQPEDDTRQPPDEPQDQGPSSENTICWVAFCERHGTRARLQLRVGEQLPPHVEACMLENGEIPPPCDHACMKQLDFSPDNPNWPSK